MLIDVETSDEKEDGLQGIIYDVQRWALHDGPGIRTIIFFKGCPLKCLWCCNPESQNLSPEIAFFASRCISCLRCIKMCKFKAIKLVKGEMETDWKLCREKCINYGDGVYPCTEMCYSQARKTIGSIMSVDEVLGEILKDYGIYKRSGGGVTISGGEPILQVDFLVNLLKNCKKKGLHTAIETSGYGTREHYESALNYLDLVFFDIKHMNSQKHQSLTGVSNDLILENARFVSEYCLMKNIDMVVRIPVIPGYNDENDNIEAIGKFISQELKKVTKVELLPFHQLGRGKYKSIGKSYLLDNHKPPKTAELNFLLEILEKYNINCKVEN